MASVRISAVRFQSLLSNRRMSASDLAELGTTVRPDDLLAEDQDVAFADLVLLATVFKRPWSYLLIDEPERFPDAGDDNRTFANRNVPPSPDMLAELQAADFILDSAAELFPDAGFSVPPIPAGDVSTTAVAEAIREHLGVTTEQQLAAKDDFAALRLWVAAIHETGVYVAQRALKDPTIRALSKTRDGQAIIVVDTGDTPYARIFSALHEYCHITLRSAGICDLDDHSTVERYCNAAAASVLLPASLLDSEIPAGAFSADADSADANLKQLSNRFHVSQAVLLIAVRDHGSISQATYEAMEARRSARRGGGKTPGGQYYPPAINRVGRLFARRVVGAMSEGAIDRQDASVLLGIGEHIVDTFSAELAKGD
jgi:Zn-dependent peptidase ImmA (M78 family)